MTVPIEWVVKSRMTGRLLIGFAEREEAVAHAAKINEQYQTDDYVVRAWDMTEREGSK